MLLSHGNGFAADLYYPFWSLLAERFELFVYDLRSHGWNPAADLLAQNIPAMIRDNGDVCRAIASEFGERPTIGVYHSISALVGLLDELRADAGFAALVLFDPPICPPGGVPEDLEASFGRVASRTRRRQDRFESRRDFVASVGGSRVFERLAPGVIELMAETTLRKVFSAGGEYELCCPIEHEAVIYDTSSVGRCRRNVRWKRCHRSARLRSSAATRPSPIRSCPAWT